MSKLKVGDTVNWNGNFGHDIAKKAKVLAITINAKDHDIEVEEIEWSEVKGRQVIVTIDHGEAKNSWAYGYQISKTNKSKRLQFKEDVENELEKQLSKGKDKILRAMNSGCIDIEQDSPHYVLTLTSAILKDLSDEMFPYSLGSNKSYEKQFRSDVENIQRFL
jgi:hypothetical protein